jgi:hypothetical protein
MAGSQRTLLTQTSLVATGIAALLVFFPRAMGITFGVITLYLFLTSLYSALRQGPGRPAVGPASRRAGGQ